MDAAVAVPRMAGESSQYTFNKVMDRALPMMTSSNGNIFRVTDPLCGEFPGPGEFPTQRPVTRSFDVFFDLRLNKRLSNNREAGDLRRYRAHYDVIIMLFQFIIKL